MKHPPYPGYKETAPDSARERRRARSSAKNNSTANLGFEAKLWLAEERIRTKLLKDGHIDTVIGLPANLFYSTGIPVCILVLKKCKKPDDVLFINAAEHFEKGKRQNRLTDEHIKKIVETYRYRKEEDRYSRRVSMERIEAEGYNLNISRYISTAQEEAEIVLADTHEDLVQLEQKIRAATAKHNTFLKELGLPPLPGVEENE